MDNMTNWMLLVWYPEIHGRDDQGLPLEFMKRDTRDTDWQEQEWKKCSSASKEGDVIVNGLVYWKGSRTMV